MNKLELIQQENEPDFNISYSLIMCSISLMVKKNILNKAIIKF